MVQAVLYTALLPLWEGFDEPFHYGYVETILHGGGLPAMGRTKVRGEIWETVKLVPASAVVRRNIPGVMTFDEYFRLGHAERTELRARLNAVPADAPAGPPNYEAHQAPLAYLALAPVDWAIQDWPIPRRVFVLRIVAAWSACLLMTFAVASLAGHLELAGLYRDVLLFLIFSTQMFYATAAHIANDWLAVSLAAWWFAALAGFSARPEIKRSWAVTLLVSLGLLAKAYFVAFVPVAVVALVWAAWRQRRPGIAAALAGLLAAAPWYVRNERLYGHLIATQEALAGVGMQRTFETARHVPWLRAARVMSHYALWTGNNSFTSFSRLTIDAMLVALGLAAVLYAIRWPPSRERAVLAACLLFLAALAYTTASNYAFQHAIAANGWYAQPILAPCLALLLCGIASAGHAGRWLCGAMMALWTWVAAATYFVKLIPLYGGFAKGRAVPAALVRWYWGDHARLVDLLSTTALAPAWVILVLAGMVTGAAAWLGAWILTDCCSAACGGKRKGTIRTDSMRNHSDSASFRGAREG